MKKCWSLRAVKIKDIECMMKLLVFLSHLMCYLPRATDFIISEKYVVFLSHYLIEREGKIFYILFSWELCRANK